MDGNGMNGQGFSISLPLIYSDEESGTIFGIEFRRERNWFRAANKPRFSLPQPI